MAIRTYDILLDSYNSTMPEPIVGRQGDKTGAVSADVTLTNGGVPVPLTGQQLMFLAEEANGEHIIADTDNFTVTNANQGQFTYKFPNALWNFRGGAKITTAYFSLKDNDGLESTFNLRFVILKAVDMSQQQAEDYVSIVDGTLRDLNSKIDDLSTEIATVVKAYNEGAFYSKTESDGRYYQKSEADARYTTGASVDSKLTGYYKKTESDSRYYTKSDSDSRYYSKSDSNDKFLSIAESSNYQKRKLTADSGDPIVSLFAADGDLNAYIKSVVGIVTFYCQGGTVGNPSKDSIRGLIFNKDGTGWIFAKSATTDTDGGIYIGQNMGNSITWAKVSATKA